MTRRERASLDRGRLAPKRGDKQERSLKRRSEIIDAIIAVLASAGIAGLTHRLVARQAGVSLAATTYYFASKVDMVTAASNVVLRGYVDAFRRAVDRVSQEPSKKTGLATLVRRLIRRATARDRVRATCWAEIVLDANRAEVSLQLSQEWFEELRRVWLDIARVTGAKPVQVSATSAIDVVIGMLLVALALRLTEYEVDAVLSGGTDPLTAWERRTPLEVPPSNGANTPKAARTRERIIEAGMTVLIEEGAAAFSYRAVAKRAGLTTAAPSYHFKTIEALLSVAQGRLFDESKQRYRALSSELRGRPAQLDALVDRTTAIFQREATEFARRNVASYSVWLQAARAEPLVGRVWTAFTDQHRAWERVLANLNPAARPIDALICQALFIGKLIRVVATGARLDDLANVRREFAQDLEAIIRSRFWI